MEITRTSIISGTTRTRHIHIRLGDYGLWLKGALIQVCMPYLSVNDREFIQSGITPEEWNTEFPPEEEPNTTEVKDDTSIE